MKRVLSLIISFILLFTFSIKTSVCAEEFVPEFLAEDHFDFENLDDPEFLQYLEDSIYANLEAQYANSESVYQIDDVSAIYVSKEYLEEIAYNTKANIFFGYNLAQINEVFQGERYVFTLSDTGETVVQECGGLFPGRK